MISYGISDNVEKMKEKKHSTFVFQVKETTKTGNKNFQLYFQERFKNREEKKKED